MAAGPAPPWKATRTRSTRPRSRPTGAASSPRLYDKTARVWREGADGRWTGTALEGHSGSVNSAAFAPDGRSIVTASDDKTARVWREGADGRWTGTALEGHSGTVNSAAFSPDGRSIVTASDDKTARVWREGADGWTGTALKATRTRSLGRVLARRAQHRHRV